MAALVAARVGGGGPGELEAREEEGERDSGAGVVGVEGPVLCVQVPPAAGAAQCLLVPRVPGPSGFLCLKPVSYTQGLNFVKESSTGFLSLASSARRAPREG